MRVLELPEAERREQCRERDLARSSAAQMGTHLGPSSLKGQVLLVLLQLLSAGSAIDAPGPTWASLSLSSVEADVPQPEVSLQQQWHRHFQQLCSLHVGQQPLCSLLGPLLHYNYSTTPHQVRAPRGRVAYYVMSTCESGPNQEGRPQSATVQGLQITKFMGR